jgi:arylsulfatase A-like enzyme
MTQPAKPEPNNQGDRPNVVFIVLDDVGFAQLGCFGSDIETPHMDALAANGLRYNNFHVTPVCSPTRASLLTGRNPHSVGMGAIADLPTGESNALGYITCRAGTLAEMLRPAGYSTFAVGKWHLAPSHHEHGAGPFEHWPLGRGFDRFYGFLGGLTDQFHPDLVADNHRITLEAEARDQPYHLSADLVDQAIRMVASQKSAVPHRPFFLYLAFGAGHSPHQVPADYVERYRGRFDDGWDAARSRWFEKQKALGVVPPDTLLPPRNDDVQPWESLTAEERRLYSRMQEVFAGFLTHTDHQIGRLTNFLNRIGAMSNTLIFLLSDNGAASAGGRTGTDNNVRQQNNLPEDFHALAERLGELGGETTSPIYPNGWAMAGNAPLKLYKQHTHGGGVRAPLIVHWPAGITDGGGIRPQFHFVADIVPTVLSAVGHEPPAHIDGIPQMPVHGSAMNYSFVDAAARGDKRKQYFEHRGHRGIWSDGWKAVTHHRKGVDYQADDWELYRTETDFSEAVNLSSTEPDRLRELVDEWWLEAGTYGVLPLDDFGRGRRLEQPDWWDGEARVFYPESDPINAQYALKEMIGRSYRVTAEILELADNGVLVALGGRFGGFSLYLKDGWLVHDYNFVGEHSIIRSDFVVPAGASTLSYEFSHSGGGRGTGRLYVDGRLCGEGTVTRTLPLYLGPEPLEVGRDTQTPVSDAYACPFEFQGSIHRVVIEIQR